MAWEINGIEGKGERPPAIAETQNGGMLIVLGGAHNHDTGVGVYTDWAKVKARFPAEEKWADLMCINDCGMYIQQDVRHWVSLHPEYLRYWIKLRRGHSLNRPILHTHHPDSKTYVDWGLDYCWGLSRSGGRSGLLGVLIGLLVGYDRIVLCGIPNDNSEHFFDPSWHRKANLDIGGDVVWEKCINTVFDNKVRAMSGLTRDWVGEPTEEWLRR